MAARKKTEDEPAAEEPTVTPEEPGPQPEPAPPYGPTPDEPLPEPSPEPAPEIEAGDPLDPTDPDYNVPVPEPEPEPVEPSEPDPFAPLIPGQDPVDPEPVIEPLDVGSLSGLLKEELYDLAQERDIEGRSEMSKSELIAALQQYAVEHGETGPAPTPEPPVVDEPADPQQFPVVDPQPSIPLTEYQRVMEENQRLQAEINKFKASKEKDSV